MDTKTASAQTSRRKFLKSSALTLGTFMIVPRYVLGGQGYIAPSDKVTLGFIGTGKLSQGLGKRFVKLKEVQMLAACDVFRPKVLRFQHMVQEHYAEVSGQSAYKGCEIYEDYAALLQRNDIDAVIIALPDHWHAKASIDAMKAGKDVYCEKPLAHTVKEGRDVVKASQQYAKILQTGSMQRSRANFLKACELVQNGYLGDIKTVKVNVGDPAIDCDLSEESTPKELNWDRWLGPAQQRGYSPVLAPPMQDNGWPMWRKYREFGGGILSDWGAHMFDIAQWGLGMDDSGPVQWIPPKDPTAVRGLKMIYANGIEMYHEDFGRGWAVQFNGTKGKLEISRKFLESDIQGLVEKEIGGGDARLYKSENHYLDWIQAIKSRKLPICHAEVGHRSASVCNIANIAYQLRQDLTWDPVKEKFKGNADANKLLRKKFRKPYKI